MLLRNIQRRESGTFSSARTTVISRVGHEDCARLVQIGRNKQGLRKTSSKERSPESFISQDTPETN
jgi:hypothetical protein